MYLVYVIKLYVYDIIGTYNIYMIYSTILSVFLYILYNFVHDILYYTLSIFVHFFVHYCTSIGHLNPVRFVHYHFFRAFFVHYSPY